MDCEKFESVVLGLLYGELDELTEAAAKRHIEHCSRCKGISSGLRATREVGTLALVDPPDRLELGILEAERRMNAKLPLGKRLGRGVSILAVYAMRPQLAMAALWPLNSAATMVDPMPAYSGASPERFQICRLASRMPVTSRLASSGFGANG